LDWQYSPFVVAQIITTAISFMLFLYCWGRRPDRSAIYFALMMFAAAGERLLLRVADDGVGLPADLDVRNTESLGLQIVSMLVEQLGGRLELDRKAGTEFRIIFEELKPRRPS
jgi:two-component sensor histidine kinase